MDALRLENVVKSYGDIHAVKGISYSVPEGSFTAFLGPNGAGKSTTIAMICSLLKPDSGSVSVFETDASDPSVKKSIGVVFQDPMMDGRLTVRENIELRGSMYRLDNPKRSAKNAMASADCLEFADRPYGSLSGGQRRRADIARALVHGPRLLILDEPTSGLDPHTRQVIWDSIDRLNRVDGITILLTTHYMEEAAGADAVIVIDKGEIVACGTPEELKDEFSRDRMTFIPRDLPEAEARLGSMGLEYSVERGVVTLPLRKTVDAIPTIEALKDLMESFEVRTGTLDEAFISITEESG